MSLTLQEQNDVAREMTEQRLLLEKLRASFGSVSWLSTGIPNQLDSSLINTSEQKKALHALAGDRIKKRRRVSDSLEIHVSADLLRELLGVDAGYACTSTVFTFTFYKNTEEEL